MVLEVKDFKDTLSALWHAALAAMLFLAWDVMTDLNEAILANTQANQELLALHRIWFERNQQ